MAAAGNITDKRGAEATYGLSSSPGDNGSDCYPDDIKRKQAGSIQPASFLYLLEESHAATVGL